MEPTVLGERTEQQEVLAEKSMNRGPSLDLDVLEASGHHLAENHAAQELLYRLNHARQTVDFVQRQAVRFSSLQHGEMDVWEALEMLNSLREYEAALLGDEGCDPEMPLMEHALQTAELCRREFPDEDWMALVGLIHGLGKLLAHQRFGAQPQWCICGESFPVGCRFHHGVVNSNFFQANPDRRRKMYSSPLGIYKKNCGLQSVYMSWSGPEYLYMVLAMNKTQLPPEALFLIRNQKFRSVLKPCQPYHELMSDWDKQQLPRLRKFIDIIEYKKRDAHDELPISEIKSYCSALIEKYIPQHTLKW
jgi:inositol oxygenase